MRSLLLVIALLVAAAAAASLGSDEAPPCDPQQCNGPNCRCSTINTIPGGHSPQSIPQIVMLTFDDAVNQIFYDNYYNDALINRQNPNGCPISATFFISHEYTDYSLVNKLYNQGHEIAIHSITHTTTTQYWEQADAALLTQEFAGERQTISHFANVPSADIRGVRTPFLALAGDNTFQVLKENGMYDCSWPTQTNVGQGLFPYTLDYKSTQDCNVGFCPTESHSGTWVVPMVDWLGVGNVPCAMVDACITTGIIGADALLDFMKQNFHRHYDNYREPFGFFVHAAWFQANSTNYDAYKMFLDYLLNLNDVYIVSTEKAVKWAQNPSTASESGSIFDCPARDQSCTNVMCVLDKPNEGQRYMKQCQADCPPNYPWLGNPLGE